jgi:hypothetical protein
MREPAAAASWPSGKRRKMKGGARALVREREGERRAGPSQPGSQGPRGVGKGVACWAGGGGSGLGRGG